MPTASSVDLALALAASLLISIFCSVLVYALARMCLCVFACVRAVLLRGGVPAHVARCQHPVRQVRADWRVRRPVQRTGFQFQPRAEPAPPSGELFRFLNRNKTSSLQNEKKMSATTFWGFKANYSSNPHFCSPISSPFFILAY